MNNEITYEMFVSVPDWRDNIQYLGLMIQNGYIKISTVIKILQNA